VEIWRFQWANIKNHMLKYIRNQEIHGPMSNSSNTFRQLHPRFIHVVLLKSLQESNGSNFHVQYEQFNFWPHKDLSGAFHSCFTCVQLQPPPSHMKDCRNCAGCGCPQAQGCGVIIGAPWCGGRTYLLCLKCTWGLVSWVGNAWKKRMQK
jgi:hypothetical protein